MIRASTALLLLALAAPVVARKPMASQAAPTGPVKPIDPKLTVVATPLQLRIGEIPGVLNGTADYDAYFAAAFKAAVPKPQFEPVRAKLIADAGKALKVASVDPINDWQATVVIDCEKTAVVVRIAVDPTAPHQVTGLAITGFVALAPTAKAVTDKLATLPGTTSFGFYKLGTGAPKLLDGRNATTKLAIGSAFKLVVFAELVRAVNAKERNWADTVTLDGAPLPGGAYTASPVGTKVSLTELATKMIQVSDNSATDVLIRALGRDKIEAMLPVTGVAPDARNRPWLTTLEMFKLKGVAGLAAKYLAVGDTAQRAMLDGPIAALPLSAISPTLFQDGKPVLIDQLEWYESPADLANVYNWLRVQTEPGMPAAPARAILSGNPGMPPGVAGKWSFAGYKGGSEPGVLAMTYLLQGKDGQWYMLAVAWNDPAKGVDLTTLGGLAAKYALLVAP